uniref:U2 small nuclear RNA auxiliary factor 1 n=1 Tax=Macrostomum lignano TaxID=282301 RepID=A0A1I8GU32_9PLAT
MAEYLASIFGTEKDKVNCSFFYKIGACRHGEQCSRLHNKPTFSQTVVLQNLYIAPANTAQTADGSHITTSEVEQQQFFDDFFEEVFVEAEEKYGEIEEMNVCDNLGDHLVGNVYLTPVTDFREACCRQYEMGECTRGGFCNFMHLKPISRDLRRRLYNRSRRKHNAGSGVGSRRSRSRSREKWEREQREKRRRRDRDRH